MKNIPKKESKKPKTASSKGKRYHCASCGKRSPKKVLEAPWYCERCVRLEDHEKKKLAEEKMSKTRF